MSALTNSVLYHSLYDCFKYGVIRLFFRLLFFDVYVCTEDRYVVLRDLNSVLSGSKSTTRPIGFHKWCILFNHVHFTCHI